MTKKNYVALHNHSDYSTLDGFSTIDEYIKVAKEKGMIGLGLTDHGTASGLYKFITRSQAAGLIPVPGVEFYVAPENKEGAKVTGPIYYGEGGKKAEDHDVSNGAYTHLTIFAYNNTGLFNLFKLTSLSWKPENFYFKPRIDTNMLAKYSEGLIATTGCPSSEISKRFLLGQDEKAYEYASRMKSIFGDNYYVELMDHKMNEKDDFERILVPKLIELSKKLDIPPIVTNDSHYSSSEHAEPHERILAVSTKSTMSEKPKHEDGKRFAFSTPEYHLKSYEEMREIFPGELGEEALENTIKLTEKCKDIKLEYNPHLRPEIEIPDGYTPATYLQKIIYDGFKKKRGNESRETQEESIKRIKNEFEVIHSNDFISYFLVVHDYINFAHKKGIAVGAGRGCFVPGTKVKANQGVMRNIEDVKVGDKVQTHDTTYQKVEDLFIYDVEDEDMTRLTLSNGKIIESTSDHMIFHEQEGFMEAKDFSVGDVVLGPKGRREPYKTTQFNLKKYSDPIELEKLTKQGKLGYKSGYFTSHRQNKKEIYYASSYEQKALNILETSSQVANFDRYKGRIPYIKPSTGLEHNYLPDFMVEMKDGSTKVVEVKAKWQLSEINTRVKLEQAEKYFNEQGIKFEIWDEDVLEELNDDWHNEFKVVKVEHYKYTGKVYDIQVENVHNYNVEGVTVHNSVGGSEIAYVLDISNTDPIRFDLLFERFLSPGRGSLYQIDYVSGESEEIAVSAKKAVYSSHGDDKVVYVHELNPGDMINHEGEKKVIQDIFVKTPGSAPDVDTDFHTEGREEVVQYCIDKYGEENVANIVTFGTFKAKKAFKAMSTIYEVPFSQANKISSLLPDNVSLAKVMDPTSPNYHEGEDFRKAVDSPKLSEVVDMATNIEGRISETGVHPCGVIISNKPLAGVIPTQVRQDDGKVITQWEYPELESLGLIKMDFLGLELLNTVQQTLENIELTNKSAQDKSLIREIPDLKELIKGEMDDKETYKLLQEGNTVGIFQLGSPGVRELLKRAKPNEFMDIATITALYRPGPMSMNSHTEWADRKNGTKEIITIDKDLKGTVIEKILQDTAGVLVYQESLMQIATRYALMTPYESDQLRKAMGKKKVDMMLSLKPKFIDGAIKNGSTKELAEKIWETMEGFGSYGFNKSHSVSYGLNIYEAAYLKANFPIEFMAAVIQQGSSDPKKVRAYVQEAKRMKLRLGPVDINNSQVKVASAGVDPKRKHDVVFGFSGVRNMNEKLSHAIVEERNKNGLFKSVADFVKRMAKVNPITSAPLANLALAGAFDEFGVSRKLVKEKAKMIVDSSEKSASKGTSLFDMMGGASNDVTESIEIKGSDYNYNEMIKLEAHVLGIYVSGHPTARLGHIARMYNPKTLSTVMNSGGSKESFNVLATISQLVSKTNKNGSKSIAILIDDGTETLTSYLPRSIVQSIQKWEELERINKAKEKGNEVKETKKSQNLKEILEDDSIKPMEPLELNDPYLFELKTRGWGDDVKIYVNDIKRLTTAPDGSLPYEVNVHNNHKLVNEIKKVTKKHEDKNGFYVKVNAENGKYIILETRVKLGLDFILEMEKIVGKDNIVTEGI